FVWSARRHPGREESVWLEGREPVEDREPVAAEDAEAGETHALEAGAEETGGRGAGPDSATGRPER
ncbi:MAG TPA: hypothetical protein VF129_12670, partial [Actinomycetota bacterium]